MPLNTGFWRISQREVLSPLQQRQLLTLPYLSSQKQFKWLLPAVNPTRSKDEVPTPKKALWICRRSRSHLKASPLCKSCLGLKSIKIFTLCHQSRRKPCHDIPSMGGGDLGSPLAHDLSPNCRQQLSAGWGSVPGKLKANAGCLSASPKKHQAPFISWFSGL